MDETQNGFRTDQQIGLFTFYQMQQRRQFPVNQNLSPFRKQNKQAKAAPMPKIFILNQNKDETIKHRVHSVVNCWKQIDQDFTTRFLSRKINLKLSDKKYSQIFNQRKQKVVDLTFDFNSFRRKNTLKKSSQSQTPLQNKKIKSICLYQQKQSMLQPHFHSVHLKRIPQIKQQNVKAHIKSNKQLQKPTKKSKIICKTQVQQSRVDQLQLVMNHNQQSFATRKQSCFINKLNKLQPLSLIGQIDKKRKKIISEYKKTKLNKKIGDIFQLKVNNNPVFGLRKLPLKDLSWLT